MPSNRMDAVTKLHFALVSVTSVTIYVFVLDKDYNLPQQSIFQTDINLRYKAE
jgi:hypothetical protein